MEKRVVGTVLSVKRQWWLKVNTKSFRRGPLDGATFPCVVTVKYVADGQELLRKKWLGPHVTPPCENESVTVVYQTERPRRCRLEFF